MILMGCVSVWNLMVARTYIQTNIPHELYEAAMLDGTTHFQYFFKIVLPLSKTIIAVLAVLLWRFKVELIILRDLSIIKDRSLLPAADSASARFWLHFKLISQVYMQTMSDNAADMAEAMRIANVAKYCIIVVATGPVVILYGFMQKYFEKGVMIGSVKVDVITKECVKIW